MFWKLFIFASGFSVKCYGQGYKEHVTGDNFNAVCSSSKMILNIPTFPGAKDYFSDRLVRTLATGACSLTLKTPGMEDYFEDGKHLLMFNDVEDCTKIANDNVKKYKEIGNNGRVHFLNNYTCKHFVEKMLEFGNL